jgi:hypothetical protein
LVEKETRPVDVMLGINVCGIYDRKIIMFGYKLLGRIGIRALFNQFSGASRDRVITRCLMDAGPGSMMDDES